MDFGEIGDVVPLLDLAHDLKQDLGVEQKGFPRRFKTHYRYSSCPRAPGTSGACVNRVLPHTTSSNCLRVGSFNLESSQWRMSLGKHGCL